MPNTLKQGKAKQSKAKQSNAKRKEHVGNHMRHGHGEHVGNPMRRAKQSTAKQSKARQSKVKKARQSKANQQKIRKSKQRKQLYNKSGFHRLFDLALSVPLPKEVTERALPASWSWRARRKPYLREFTFEGT